MENKELPWLEVQCAVLSPLDVLRFLRLLENNYSAEVFKLVLREGMSPFEARKRLEAGAQ